MKRSLSLVLIVLLFALAGCAADGSITNPFSTPEPPNTPFYFADFTDVPLPHPMSEVRSESVITYAASGVKCGVQRFKGSVDASSLISTMRNNMTSQGWALTSMLRANESVLTFEKADRLCTLYITDDTLYTNMRIFVTPRLSEGTQDQYVAPVAPIAPMDDSAPLTE